MKIASSVAAIAIMCVSCANYKFSSESKRSSGPIPTNNGGISGSTSGGNTAGGGPTGSGQMGGDGSSNGSNPTGGNGSGSNGGSTAGDLSGGPTSGTTAGGNGIDTLNSGDIFFEKSYSGACIGVRHGGSERAADQMNRKYSPQYEASCDVVITVDKDVPSSIMGQIRLEASFVSGVLEHRGKTYPEGRQPQTPASKCHQTKYRTDVTAEIATLSDLFARGDAVKGDHNKGNEWKVAYDPTTKTVKVTAIRNGWGACRWTDYCGACIEQLKILLIKK